MELLQFSAPTNKTFIVRHKFTNIFEALLSSFVRYYGHESCSYCCVPSEHRNLYKLFLSCCIFITYINVVIG